MQLNTQNIILHTLFEILSVQIIICLIIMSFIYNNMDSMISILSLGL